MASDTREELTPIQKIETDLRAPETLAEIKAMAPAGSDVERVIVAVMQSIERDKRAPSGGKLQLCSPSSVRLCVLQSLELGLIPSGTMGDAYLVPYAGVATLVPGYRGLARLAQESGAARNVRATEVYRGEKFEWCEGSDARIVHVPDLEKRTHEKADVVAVYAIATLADGSEIREVCSVKEIERVAKAVKSDKVWGPHWVEMARKTAIRRLLKKAPINPVKASAFARAVALDEENDERTVDTTATVVPDRPVPVGETPRPAGRRAPEPDQQPVDPDEPPQQDAQDPPPPAADPAPKQQAPAGEKAAPIMYGEREIKSLADCAPVIVDAHNVYKEAGRDAAKEWFAAHQVTFSIEAIKQATGKGRVFAKVGDAARAIVTFTESAVPIAPGE